MDLKGVAYLKEIHLVAGKEGKKEEMEFLQGNVAVRSSHKDVSSARGSRRVY